MECRHSIKFSFQCNIYKPGTIWICVCMCVPSIPCLHVARVFLCVFARRVRASAARSSDARCAGRMAAGSQCGTGERERERPVRRSLTSELNMNARPEPLVPSAKRLLVGFCSLAIVLLVVTSTPVFSPHTSSSCVLVHCIVHCSLSSLITLSSSSHSANVFPYSLSFARCFLMQSNTRLTRIVCSYYSFCS